MTSSGDDIGLYCTAGILPGGGISLSCLNATQQSLVMTEMDAFGTWAPVLTVDPGPYRGSYCDHVYHPARGYAFSEYDSEHGSLIYIDAVLEPLEWEVGTVTDRFESGRYVSSCLAPDGRVASAFYYYNTTVLGSVLISGLDASGGSIVRAVVDSIADDPLSEVFIDMAVTPEWNWHITYRSPLDGFLWYASADSYVVTGTGGENGEPPLPVLSDFRLYQNTPNPFNPVTSIRFYLPREADIKLSVYAVNGEHVSTLVDERLSAGFKEVRWNALNNRGRPLASGVYFYRLTAGDFVQTKKMVLLR